MHTYRTGGHEQRWLQQQNYLGCNTWRAVGRTRPAVVSALFASLTPRGLDLDTFGGISNDEMRAELLRMTNELEVCTTLNAPPQAAIRLLSEVELRMSVANPYHNFRHMYDVAQFLYTMLKRSGFRLKTVAQKSRPRSEDNQQMSSMVKTDRDELSLTPLEIAALWCACLCHDLEHPGHSSYLEEAVRGPAYQAHKAAKKAKPFSLELHHATVACQLVCEELRLLEGVTTEEADHFLEMMRAVIAATQMEKHGEFYANFHATCTAFLGGQFLEKKMEGSGMQQTVAGGAVEREELDESVQQSRAGLRLQLMQWLMKCSDLANTMRPPGCFERWEDAIFEEFYDEGDALVTHGLVKNATQLPPRLDRRSTRLLVQVDFLRGVVLPTFKLLEHYLCAAPGLKPEMATECRVLVNARLKVACSAAAIESSRQKMQRRRRAGILGVLSSILVAVFAVKCLRPWPLAMIDARQVFSRGDGGATTMRCCAKSNYCGVAFWHTGQTRSCNLQRSVWQH